MSRITASSPHAVSHEGRDRNDRYDEGPKPFNFLVSPHVAPLGHPPGVEPQHFHLVAPYTPDARQWTKMSWTDVYSGEAFRIATGDAVWSDRTAHVLSYGDVIARHHTHPEAKSLGPDGTPCGKRTVGLLQRRPVELRDLVHIGKETNRLEAVEQGLMRNWDDVQLVFRELGAHGRAPIGPSGITQVQRKCRSCDSAIAGIRRLYCSPSCRQRACRRRKRCAAAAGAAGETHPPR